MGLGIATALTWWYRDFRASHRRRSGIDEDARVGSAAIYVSLTSIPERISSLHLNIDSLLSQSRKPKRILLWLSREHFSSPDELPEKLLNLQRFGLHIGWVEGTSAHRKLIPALRQFPDDIIVTADDDIYYPRDWLADLIAAHSQSPDIIHAHRTRMIGLSSDGTFLPYSEWPVGSPAAVTPSHLVLATGGGGVVYPPRSLHPDTTDMARAVSLTPTTDDLWFKAMAIRAGTLCRAIRHPPIILTDVPRADDDRPLWSFNQKPTGNDRQWQQVVDEFDLMDRLKEP